MRNPIKWLTKPAGVLRRAAPLLVVQVLTAAAVSAGLLSGACAAELQAVGLRLFGLS